MLNRFSLTMLSKSRFGSKILGLQCCTSEEQESMGRHGPLLLQPVLAVCWAVLCAAAIRMNEGS